MPAKVTDYMAAKVISVVPDIGLREACFTLREHDIRHLPVIEPDGKLAGIVNDRELRRPDWVGEARDLAHVYYLDDGMLVRGAAISGARQDAQPVCLRNPDVRRHYAAGGGMPAGAACR